MPAGGFKTFVSGEILTAADTNDYLMQGMLVFAGTAARGSAITSPVEGQFSFLKDTDTVQYYDGSAWVTLESGPVAVDYVVVGAGGGGGAAENAQAGDGAGGGGAGGYRTNITGASSGGGASAEAFLYLPAGSYPLIVGAGGAGRTITGSFPGTAGGVGGDTTFHRVVSVGGGGGGGARGNGANGGSGGGAGGQGLATLGGLAGLFLLGFAGGNGNSGRKGAGGGGAVEAGNTDGYRSGGDGVASSITGSAVTRAGGGSGGDGTNTNVTVAGGDGGGGTGGATNADNATAGSANTGGGGGGGGAGQPSKNGGSGVVIFAVPTGTSVSFSGGVTQTNSTVGLNRVYTVTAAGPTDTVTIG